MANQVSSNDQPIRGTDHIYRSGQRSTISRSRAVSRRNRQNLVRAIATPPAADPRRAPTDGVESADKYYRAYEAEGPVVGNLSQQAPREVVTRPFEMAPNLEQSNQPKSVRMVEIDKAADIVMRIRNVIDYLRSGVQQVTVRLANDDLVRASRQALELAVTRGDITEDQSRDVVFGVVPQQGLLDEPPQPSEDRDLEDPSGNDLGDPLEFINRDDEEGTEDEEEDQPKSTDVAETDEVEDEITEDDVPESDDAKAEDEDDDSDD